MKRYKTVTSIVLIVFPFLFLSNWSLSQPITSLPENFYLLTNYGCNILVVGGDDGLLVIDTGYEGLAAKTDSAIHSVKNIPVKFILNTHLHFDHVGGNKKLSEDGAVIVSQENTRKHMITGWETEEIQGMKYPTIPPFPAEALPVICFNDSLTLFFNNTVFKGIYYPNAHSDCDVIYYNHDFNVIHAGDLFESNGFPILDVFYGGTIDGYIKAVENIIQLCDDQTLIIPGHGAVSNVQGLMKYRDMLVESRGRIAELVEDGKSLDEVVAANPTKGLFKGGKSWVPENLFVATVYMDLSNN